MTHIFLLRDSMLKEPSRRGKQRCDGQGRQCRPHARHTHSPIAHVSGIQLEGSCEATLCSGERHHCCWQNFTANQNSHLQHNRVTSCTGLFGTTQNHYLHGCQDHHIGGSSG